MPARIPPDFRALFESAPALYLVLAPDFTILAASDAYLRATLTRREQIIGRPLFEVFPDNPDDPTADGVGNLRASLQRVLNNETADRMAIQKYDIRRPESEGGGFEERYWSPANSPVFGPDGEVAYIIHHVADVTEVVRLRQRGIEQETVVRDLRADERFRKAFEANPEPITISTLDDGRYLDVNQSFLRVTGFRREEIIGRTAAELNLLSPAEHPRLCAVLDITGSVRNLEVAFRTKSGESRTGVKSAEIIEVAGQKCVLAILKDVTEQRLLEKKLAQAQKMEAIGQLSGGIAHDFNNLLSVIIGYSEVLEADLPPDPALRRNLQQIKSAGEKAALLTRQLLAFSRQQLLQPRVMNLNAAVADMEQMLRRLIGEDIEFRTNLDPSLGSIHADPGQVAQIIMNLAVNARDAMPKGGRLVIETANAEIDQNYARLHPPQQPGSYVVLTVSDTGIGMDPATQARIFDPFFTTKEVGKGTGLGLSTVYGVVKQSGGFIWVYSEPGHGTTFRIYFPRALSRPEVPSPRPAPAEDLRGSESILLVEDESALRELTQKILVRQGYTVFSADTPQRALEIARSIPHLDLLLTDVVMSGMNGPELAKLISLQTPGLKVIYMSGYTRFSHQALLDPPAVLLPKPLRHDALVRTVREVLSSELAAKS